MTDSDGTPPETRWDDVPPTAAAPDPAPYPNPYATPYANPYGTPYPAPPGYPPPGYAPAPPGFNGLAISSLITGILCCTWPLALGLGIGALVQLRKRPQRGRGMAVAGVVLGTLGLCSALLGAFTGRFHFDVHASSADPAVNAPADPGNPGAAPDPSGSSGWRPGDCFDERDGGKGTVRTRTDCAQPHFGEVFSVTPVIGDGSGYPGVQSVIQQATIGCSSNELTYITDSWARDQLNASYQIRFAFPDSAAAWQRSGHLAVCFLHKQDGLGTGSLRQDDTTLSQDQQHLLSALSSLELRQKALAIQVTDPAQASVTAQTVAQSIADTLTTLGGTRWSDSAKTAIATLTGTLKAEQPLWAAAGDNTTDPVGAYHQVLADHSPITAEAAARAALSLADHDVPAGPALAVPDLPGGGTGGDGGADGDGGGSAGGNGTGGGTGPTAGAAPPSV